MKCIKNGNHKLHVNKTFKDYYLIKSYLKSHLYLHLLVSKFSSNFSPPALNPKEEIVL